MSIALNAVQEWAVIQMNELKQCPFCGGKAETIKGFIAGVTMIVCNNCKATVSFGGREARDKTIQAWNRRYNNESK